MPPRRLNVARTAVRLPRSTVIAPLARTEGTLKAYALGGLTGGTAQAADAEVISEPNIFTIYDHAAGGYTNGSGGFSPDQNFMIDPNGDF